MRVIQFIWLLPVTILTWVFYVIPMCYIFGDLIWCGWHKPFIGEFVLASENLEPWYAKMWRDWGGWGGPCVIIRRHSPDMAWVIRTMTHETVHCEQQFRWGIFFYPAYIIASLWIWLFQKGKHAYCDNPFEREARRVAGQPVDIPKYQWKDGPWDRWSWW